MKKLLLILAIAATAVSARAQTTTNITVRWTVETVTGGVTNSTVNILALNYSTKKDALRVDGLNFAYAGYVAGQGTNAVVEFGPWLKSNYLGLVGNYVQQKQQADYATILAKLTLLLNGNTDLLTAAELNQLADIAAKAP